MRYGPQKTLDVMFAFAVLGIIGIAFSLVMNYDINYDTSNDAEDEPVYSHPFVIPDELQIVFDGCGMRFYEPDIKLVFTNDTHFIDNIDCEWTERGFVSTTPFGYYPRDTTGNYDHCFSYKTDPEYGVKIQNTTHTLNVNNCEWELKNEN